MKQILVCLFLLILIGCSKPSKTSPPETSPPSLPPDAINPPPTEEIVVNLIQLESLTGYWKSECIKIHETLSYKRTIGFNKEDENEVIANGNIEEYRDYWLNGDCSEQYVTRTNSMMMYGTFDLKKESRGEGQKINYSYSSQKIELHPMFREFASNYCYDGNGWNGWVNIFGRTCPHLPFHVGRIFKEGETSHGIITIKEGEIFMSNPSDDSLDEEGRPTKLMKLKYTKF